MLAMKKVNKQRNYTIPKTFLCTVSLKRCDSLAETMETRNTKTLGQRSKSAVAKVLPGRGRGVTLTPAGRITPGGRATPAGRVTPGAGRVTPGGRSTPAGGGVQQRLEKQKQMTSVLSKTIGRKVHVSTELLKQAVVVPPERIGKRTPKPNRRYMNDELVSDLPEKDSNDDDDSMDEQDAEAIIDSDEEFEEPSPASTRKRLSAGQPKSEPLRKTIAKPMPKMREAEPQTGLTKRKLNIPADSSESEKKRGRPKKITVRIDSDEDDEDIDDDESDDEPIMASPPRSVRNRKSDSPQLEAKRSALLAALKSKLTPSPIANAQRVVVAQAAAVTASVRANLVAATRVTQKVSTPKTVQPAGLQAKKAILNTSSGTSNTTPARQIISRPIAARPAAPRPPPARPATAKPNSAATINNDLEDFEQMPTFTIVNINDIINQKEEIVVIQSPKNNKIAATSTIKKPTPIAKKMTIPQKNRSFDDDIEYQPDGLSEADDDEGEDDEDDDYDDDYDAKPSPNNRRKSQHTKILSEKIKSTAANLRGPNNVSKTPVVNTTRPYRNIIGNTKNGKLNTSDDKVSPNAAKPPVRILNSTLCRNAENNTLTPLVTKVTKKPPTRQAMINNNNAAIMLRHKENMKTYNADRSRANLAAKQSTESDVTLLPGNRRVRKITCFETWFVIKMPSVEPLPHRYSFGMSMIQLGNEAATIALPSDLWSLKVTLQKRSAEPEKKTNASDDDSDPEETYTGIVQDKNVNENEKHLYQPANIMFRRSTNGKVRTPFDRAIIFKNNSFFINVDGKNVLLLGAPQTLADVGEIETLLQIVDDVSLMNSCIEPYSYAN